MICIKDCFDIMKVGIFTYHFSDNYGALFQAYALRHYLRSVGFYADFVPYHPAYVEEGGDLNYSRPFSKDNAKIIYLKIVSAKERLFGNRELKQGFSDFKASALGLSGRSYRASDELFSEVGACDFLVTGSDQVWRPSDHYGVDPVYYLAFPFVYSGKRISYAPSFGTDTLAGKYQSEVSELLREMDAISVREESGADIVEGLVSVRPKVVPDPTFLLESYDDVAKPYPLPADGKFVFTYALRSGDVIRGVSCEIANKVGANLYSPHNPHRRWKSIGKTVYPCPKQWLWLLTNASYVVTNSFHGVALSILQNKTFVYVPLAGDKSDFNARAMNLISSVGLEGRMFCNRSNDISTILAAEIDWPSVNARVDAMRNTGREFLASNLGFKADE